jgi:hypothetical protein
MEKKLLVPFAKIMESRFPVVRDFKTMFGASALTGSQYLTFSAPT